jgi:hypothetical protein
LGPSADTTVNRYFTRSCHLRALHRVRIVIAIKARNVFQSDFLVAGTDPVHGPAHAPRAAEAALKQCGIGEDADTIEYFNAFDMVKHGVQEVLFRGLGTLTASLGEGWQQGQQENRCCQGIAQ